MATNPYSVSSTAAARATDLGKASGSTGTSVSEREDLANFISMITRDETPFMSDIGKTKATAIFHEWQTDELQAPRDSRLSDGADWDQVPPDSGGATDSADADFTAPNRTRLGNYTQINGKTIAVSGTRRAIDQAGVADEYAYQLKKRGTELRRDVEAALVGSPGTTLQQSSGSGMRAMGGYYAWINESLDSSATINGIGTNITGATGQAGNGTVKYVFENPGSSTNVSANVVTDANAGIGSSVPGFSAVAVRTGIQLSHVDEVMQAIYENGGKATKIMLSPKLRRDFSSQANAAGNVRRNIDEKGSLRQSVDMYMSDFGDLMVMPNYIMGLGNVANYSALIYDPMWFNIATLRPLQEVDVGQRGDSTVGMIVEECTLEVRNPLGAGGIYGLE